LFCVLGLVRPTFVHRLCWIWRHADTSRSNPDFSPLHNRCLKLFACLTHDWHDIWFDNLYSTVKFFRYAYVVHKIMCSGVARKNQVPPELSMDVVTSEKDLARVKGTVKAAVLMGDKRAPFLVGATLYDSKPVRFLSYFVTGIWWVEKIRQVWDRNLRKTVPLKFLRLNINNMYNEGMGGVDQVRFPFSTPYRHWNFLVYKT
jgi:hypothetical protein